MCLNITIRWIADDTDNFVPLNIQHFPVHISEFELIERWTIFIYLRTNTTNCHDFDDNNLNHQIIYMKVTKTTKTTFFSWNVARNFLKISCTKFSNKALCSRLHFLFRGRYLKKKKKKSTISF